MKRFNIENEVKSYIKEGFGSEWISFWKYKENFKNQLELFDNIYKLSYKLHYFLIQFGMGRNSNTILRSYTSDDFIKLIKSYKEIIKKTGLFSLEINSSKDFNKKTIDTINKTFIQFYEVDRKTNYLFQSKILMAIWGHTIAYDLFFITAYKDIHNNSPNNFDWGELNEKLFNLHSKEILKNNGALLTFVKEKYKLSNIPIIRIIDMAYWNWGRKLLDDR